MANGFYIKGSIKGFPAGDDAWDSDTYRAVLGDAADYTVDLNTHDRYDDVSAGTEEGPVTIGTRTVADDGILDGDDVVFTGASGDPCEYIIVFKDTGTPSTSPLFIYIDTATGLPVTLNGGNVTVTWDNGTNKIVKI